MNQEYKVNYPRAKSQTGKSNSRWISFEITLGKNALSGNDELLLPPDKLQITKSQAEQ